MLYESEPRCQPVWFCASNSQAIKKAACSGRLWCCLIKTPILFREGRERKMEHAYPSSLCGAGFDGCRPVTALFCFPERLGGLFRGDQWNGLHRLTGATRGKCHGDCGGAYVIRQIDNHNDIVVSEGKPGGFNLATQFFNRRPHGFDTVLWICYQCFPAFLGICDLLKVMWHRASF